jgi:hypothetical protein
MFIILAILGAGMVRRPWVWFMRMDGLCIEKESFGVFRFVNFLITLRHMSQFPSPGTILHTMINTVLHPNISLHFYSSHRSGGPSKPLLVRSFEGSAVRLDNPHRPFGTLETRVKLVFGLFLHYRDNVSLSKSRIAFYFRVSHLYRWLTYPFRSLTIP